MTASEIIKAIMKKKKIRSYKDLNVLVGGSPKNTTYWRVATGKSAKVNTLLTILDALGYEVVVRPKGKYRPKYNLTKEGEEV